MCSTGLTEYQFTAQELMFMSRENKEKAKTLNCLLHKKCGVEINAPEQCDKKPKT